MRADPIVNNSANLCGEIITNGKNVKARIIHTTPAAARIANVVNRSFVDEMSSIDDLAVDSLAEAQFIRPADSSSFCSDGGVELDVKSAFTAARPPDDDDVAGAADLGGGRSRRSPAGGV